MVRTKFSQRKTSGQGSMLLEPAPKVAKVQESQNEPAAEKAVDDNCDQERFDIQIF